MYYKILADSVVLIHFLWILFLLFGALIGTRNRAIKIIHISGLAFAIVLQVFDWNCPLTHLEVWLRKKHNPAITYTGSFIIYYIEKIVYVELSRKLIFVFSIFLSGMNAWLYLRKSYRS
jgi:hypothetical protein